MTTDHRAQVDELLADYRRSRDQLALRAMLERAVRTSPQERAAMGARAREKVLERHDPEIYTRFMLAVDSPAQPSSFPAASAHA